MWAEHKRTFTRLLPTFSTDENQLVACWSIIALRTILFFTSAAATSPERGHIQLVLRQHSLPSDERRRPLCYDDTTGKSVTRARVKTQRKKRYSLVPFLRACIKYLISLQFVTIRGPDLLSCLHDFRSLAWLPRSVSPNRYLSRCFSTTPFSVSFPRHVRATLMRRIARQINAIFFCPPLFCLFLKQWQKRSLPITPTSNQAPNWKWRSKLVQCSCTAREWRKEKIFF